MLGGYTAALVFDRDLKGALGGLLGLDGKVAPLGHGLHGVQEEVQEDLLDLAGVHSEGEVGILIGLVDGHVLFEEVIA